MLIFADSRQKSVSMTTSLERSQKNVRLMIDGEDWSNTYGSVGFNVTLDTL